MKTDLIFPIADPHTGSIYGLHPNYIRRNGEWITVDEAGGWYYKNNPHYYLNSKQVRMWKHYEANIKAIRTLREKIDCNILFVGMGDMIDGDHHGTHQLATQNESEQMFTFCEMMKWTFEAVGFQYGRDKLAIVEGTESHTRDNEEIIARMLSAEKFSDGASCTPFFETDIQGNLFWFFHHGAAAGYSYNKGMGLYNYMRRIYIDRKMNDKPVPDVIVTADKHDPDYQTYRHNGRELHGVICAPLQDKTRFSNRLPNVIVHESKLGFSPILVDNGKVNVLPSYIFEMPLNEVLKW